MNLIAATSDVIVGLVIAAWLIAVVLAAATFVYRLRHRDANPPATSDDVGDDGGEDLAGSGV